MSKLTSVSSLLTFRVGQYRFCVDAVEAAAIVQVPEIRSVPLTPRSIAGLFPYRDRVVVVVNLHRKLGLQDLAKLSGQIILVSIDGELKGFWVDEVLEILKITTLNGRSCPNSERTGYAATPSSKMRVSFFIPALKACSQRPIRRFWGVFWHPWPRAVRITVSPKTIQAMKARQAQTRRLPKPAKRTADAISRRTRG